MTQPDALPDSLPDPAPVDDEERPFVEEQQVPAEINEADWQEQRVVVEDPEEEFR